MPRWAAEAMGTEKLPEGLLACIRNGVLSVSCLRLGTTRSTGASAIGTNKHQYKAQSASFEGIPMRASSSFDVPHGEDHRVVAR